MESRAQAALDHNRYNLLNCINDDNSVKTQASEILRDDSDEESMNDSIEDIETHKIPTRPEQVVSLPCPAPVRSRRERSPMITNATKETIDFYTTNEKNLSLSITSKTFNVCSMIKYSSPPSSSKHTTSSSESVTDSDIDNSTDFTNPSECVNLFKDIRKYKC